MHEFDVRSTQAASRRDQPSTVRRRLLVGPADDPAERHADAVAAEVMAHLDRSGGAMARPAASSRIRPMSGGVVRRAFRPATVTKGGGASLHKSDRKSKKAATRGSAKVRSGGVFGTGLKINVPNGVALQVDDDMESSDTHYIFARYNGVEGYIRKTNVTAAPLAPTTVVTGPTLVPTGPVESESSSESESGPEPESSSSSEEETLDDVVRKAGNLHDGLDAAFDTFAGLTIDHLSPFIDAASQGERDAVWQDPTLMAKAKAELLHLNDYLALLPALRVFTPPTTGVFPGAQGTYTGHTPAAQVDILIGTHLGHYVAKAKAAGRKAEGEISVVGGQDWVDAYNRQWPGQPTTANAFVDVDQPKRHIWLHKDRGDPGTAIHEGMHKYANDEIRNRQRALYRTGMVPIGMLDEGLTEYFCRLITSTIGINRTSYPNQLEIATALVGHTGEAVAAKAYFDGKFDRFIDAYLAATGRSAAHWDHLSRHFEQEKWVLAKLILASGAET